FSQRNYGGVQLIWGALDQIKWIDRWNPISQDVPMVILHHHPCFYSIEPIPDKDMYNCDLAISAISKALSTHGVEYANIHLNSHVNFFTIIYNQSNLGFCKDRNGVSF
ncbi:Tumor protein p63-regulated gene 1-like protein, partial [Schistosoma japonicum]